MGIKELSYGVERTSTTSAERKQLLNMLATKTTAPKKSRRGNRAKQSN